MINNIKKFVSKLSEFVHTSDLESLNSILQVLQQNICLQVDCSLNKVVF